MNTVAYLNSPSPEAREEQEAKCRQYAQAHGFTISETYVESHRPRPALDRLLDAARQGEVSTVIVADNSCLGRHHDENTATVEALHDLGVSICITPPAPEVLEQFQAELMEALAGYEGHGSEESPALLLVQGIMQSVAEFYEYRQEQERNRD